MTYQHQVVSKVVESIRTLISKPASPGHAENLAAPEKCANNLESRRCYRYSALYFSLYFSINNNRQTTLVLSSVLFLQRKLGPENRFYRIFDLTLSRKRGENRAIFVSLVTSTPKLCNGVS